MESLSGEEDLASRGLLEGWLARRGMDAEMAETHVSVLAFTLDRVYKLKKPVRFPFLDLTNPEHREDLCHREVELNRRIAPDVYLGVCDVTDERGLVVDHAVEMVRMPQALRLAHLIERGEAEECIDRLAELLARFHADCETGGPIDAATSWQGASHLWDMAFEQTERFVGHVLDEATARSIEQRVRRYLAGRRPLFAARVAAGCGRDGHGDLLTEDVYCLPDSPRVLDCIEFDDTLRYGDTLADIAFLAMDLERRGFDGLARRFLERYSEASGDDWPPSLEHHWIAYRAHVRAKIACLRSEHGDHEGAQHAHIDLELAARHLDDGRVRLVLVGGAPGTGKSTLAARLGDAKEWRVLRSDTVRNELLGGRGGAASPDELDQGRYTPDSRARVYDDLLSQAKRHLGLGDSVVIDASWADASDRERAHDVAHRTSSDMIGLQCDAPASVSSARIRDRLIEGRDPSEVTPEIATAIRARFDPWSGVRVIDTGGSIEDALIAAVERVSDPSSH